MQGVEEMRYSSHPRLTLEMTFIKAVQAGQVVPASELLARLDALVRGGLSGVQSDSRTESAVPERQAVPLPEKPQRAVPAGRNEGSKVSFSRPSPPPSPKRMDDLPPAPEVTRPEKELPSPVKEQEGAGEEVAIATDGKNVRKNWNEFADYVKERKQWMAQVLRLCENPREEDATLVIRFDNPSDCLLLKKTDNLKDLARYAQDFFQKELRVKIGTRDGEEESGGTDDGASPREERRALASDPLVRMVTEIFDGKVSAIRTGPRFR
jgi:DNA polymerase-3 subunit gamma/tau